LPELFGGHVRSPGVRRLGIATGVIAAVAVAAACVIPWIPVWPCMLFEHFRAHYVVIGVVTATVTAALRLRGLLRSRRYSDAAPHAPGGR
jgi:hypothetical protein